MSVGDWYTLHIFIENLSALGFAFFLRKIWTLWHLKYAMSKMMILYDSTGEKNVTLKATRPPDFHFFVSNFKCFYGILLCVISILRNSSQNPLIIIWIIWTFLADNQLWFCCPKMQQELQTPPLKLLPPPSLDSRIFAQNTPITSSNFSTFLIDNQKWFWSPKISHL